MLLDNLHFGHQASSSAVCVTKVVVLWVAVWPRVPSWEMGAAIHGYMPTMPPYTIHHTAASAAAAHCFQTPELQTIHRFQHSVLNYIFNVEALYRRIQRPMALRIVCSSTSHTDWLRRGKSGDDRRAAAAQRPGLMDHRLIKIFRRIKNIWTCLLFTTGWLMTSIIIIIFCIGYRFTWWWSYLVGRW